MAPLASVLFTRMSLFQRRAPRNGQCLGIHVVAGPLAGHPFHARKLIPAEFVARVGCAFEKRVLYRHSPRHPPARAHFHSVDLLHSHIRVTDPGVSHPGNRSVVLGRSSRPLDSSGSWIDFRCGRLFRWRPIPARRRYRFSGLRSDYPTRW